MMATRVCNYTTTLTIMNGMNQSLSCESLYSGSPRTARSNLRSNTTPYKFNFRLVATFDVTMS